MAEEKRERGLTAGTAEPEDQAEAHKETPAAQELAEPQQADRETTEPAQVDQALIIQEEAAEPEPPVQLDKEETVYHPRLLVQQ